MPLDGTYYDHDDPILRAADFIEARPDLYRFIASKVPGGPECGTPGCLLGWIGAFAGTPRGKSVRMVARDLFGFEDDMDFYEMMNDAVGGTPWTVDAKYAAKGLRIIAATRRAELAEKVPA